MMNQIQIHHSALIIHHSIQHCPNFHDVAETHAL